LEDLAGKTGLSTDAITATSAGGEGRTNAPAAEPAGTLLVPDGLQWAGADVFALLCVRWPDRACEPHRGTGPHAHRTGLVALPCYIMDSAATLPKA
jgi:hypothetical protein